MTKDDVIKRVYKVLDKVTPLKTDCGILCNGECCKGDNITGMVLFPGEEVLYKDDDNFSIIDGKNGNKILVCSGKCDRTLRPISCRIFPLVPVIYDEKLYIIDDPRAFGVCPLIRDKIKLNPRFERTVYKAGKILLKNENTTEFLISLTDEISEILSMRENFLK